MKEEEEKREYEEWEKSLPHVGDTVIVVKGRTLPKGTVGKVVKEFTYQASYNNIITYLVLEDGNKINRANTRKVN